MFDSLDVLQAESEPRGDPNPGSYHLTTGRMSAMVDREFELFDKGGEIEVDDKGYIIEGLGSI